MLLFVGLALALYVIYRLVALLAGGGDDLGRRGARILGIASLIVAVGVAGAALTLLPAYRMAGHTGRGHLPYKEATRYSLPPRALVGLVAPGFYGRGPAGFWGPWDRVEVGYAGVGTLLLAALGLAACASRRLSSDLPARAPSRDRRTSGSRSPTSFPVIFFVILVLVAFSLAMGRHAPFYRVLYRWVPTFDQIRAPARLIVLGDLGLAGLAAYGLHHLLEGDPSQRPLQRWIVLGALIAALLIVAVGLPQARSLPPSDRVPQTTRSVVIAASLLALNGLLVASGRRWSWTGWLFPLLLAVDLIALGSTLEIEPNDPSRGFRHPEVVAYLRQDPALFRIEDTAAAWQPDAALMHGLYDIGGIYNPLALAPYEAYRWALGQRAEPLYNLLGVKYVLADEGDPPGDQRLVPVYTAAPEIDVYLNTAALPRALFVTSPRVVSDHTEAWKAIHEPGFDPTRTIVLEQAQVKTAVEAARIAPGRDQAAHLAFVRYGLNAVEIRVEAPTSGWLLLSDVYYPGWRATIDGAPTSVLRADYAFRAVRVPAGDHEIEMTFAPRTWRVGLVLSLTTWLALAAGAARRLRSRP
jgi:hypothetical protein